MEPVDVSRFYKDLLKISKYLTEDSLKAEYVLNCFLNQEVILNSIKNLRNFTTVINRKLIEGFGS